MIMSSEDDGVAGAAKAPFSDDANDEDLSGRIDNEAPKAATQRAAPDRNETRSRRRKLREMASVIPLDESEITVLASAGMMMPDPYRLLLETDPGRRLKMAESDARSRVQYTNLMVPPSNIDDLLSEDPKPVRIGSKEYERDEISMAELMIAVRSSAKVLSSFRVAYAEQYALHEELLRLVQERQVTSRMRRLAVPGYLIDFARIMESLGCKRNHLRENSRIVRLVRDALKLDGSKAVRSVEEATERHERWMIEDEAIASIEESDAEPDGSEDEFDRLWQIAAKAARAGDMDAARAAFADLEAYEASLEDEFGSTGSGQTEDDKLGGEDQNLDLVDAAPSEGSAETGNASTAAPDKVEPGAVEAKDTPSEEKAASPPDLPSGQSTPSAPAAPLSPTTPQSPVPSPAVTAIPNDPSPDLEPPSTPSYLTDWGVTAPTNVQHSRVTGIGRLAGGDAFGGVVSTATLTPDVVPMWDRKDRQTPAGERLTLGDASAGERLTLDDWYRFEVPFGPYALVHMPKKLNEYVPVRDEMFPPYPGLERYGTVAGFSEPDMRFLKVADMGRGPMEMAKQAVGSALGMSYGKHDEDLLRFWMFLLVGRRFMHRIDDLFPDGYFHGVKAPDPAARDAGAGSFRIVRVLDDGKLDDRLRTPDFAPFDKTEASQPTGAI